MQLMSDNPDSSHEISHIRLCHAGGWLLYIENPAFNEGIIIYFLCRL